MKNVWQFGASPDSKTISSPLLLFQDVFTSGIGWLLFRGLPYDLVKTNSFAKINSWLVHLITLFYLLKFYAMLCYVPSSMFLVNQLASWDPVCMPIVNSKEYEDDLPYFNGGRHPKVVVVCRLPLVGDFIEKHQNKHNHCVLSL